MLLEKRFENFVEFSKQSGDRSASFHGKMTDNAVAMPMDVAALVLQFLVAVGSVKLVAFLNVHAV